MDIDSNILKANMAIDNDLKGLKGDEPVGDIPLYSHHVFEILIRDFSDSQTGTEVFSLEDDVSYSLSFEFCEIKDADGLVGEYEQMPSMDDIPKIQTIVFEVTGMHRSKVTEIEVTGERILSSPARERKHLLLLQKAILNRNLKK
jgi:hypothetical protein